ncbi:MAG: hypothetical protein ACI8R8_003098, partial [Paraglaciecola sp.]
QASTNAIYQSSNMVDWQVVVEPDPEAEYPIFYGFNGVYYSTQLNEFLITRNSWFSKVKLTNSIEWIDSAEGQGCSGTPIYFNQRYYCDGQESQEGRFFQETAQSQFYNKDTLKLSTDFIVNDEYILAVGSYGSKKIELGIENSDTYIPSDDLGLTKIIPITSYQRNYAKIKIIEDEVLALGRAGELWKFDPNSHKLIEYKRASGDGRYVDFAFGNDVWVFVGAENSWWRPFRKYFSSPSVIQSGNDLNELSYYYIGDDAPFEVSFGNNFFVTITKNKIFTSNNGQQWTEAFESSGHRFIELTFGKGLFIVTGENNTYLTSSDGVSWHNQKIGLIDTENRITGLEYDAESGTFYGTYNGNWAESSNGIDWTFFDKETGNDSGSGGCGETSFNAVVGGVAYCYEFNGVIRSAEDKNFIYNDREQIIGRSTNVSRELNDGFVVDGRIFQYSLLAIKEIKLGDLVELPITQADSGFYFDRYWRFDNFDVPYQQGTLEYSFDRLTWTPVLAEDTQYGGTRVLNGINAISFGGNSVAAVQIILDANGQLHNRVWQAIDGNNWQLKGDIPFANKGGEVEQETIIQIEYLQSNHEFAFISDMGHLYKTSNFENWTENSFALNGSYQYVNGQHIRLGSGVVSSDASTWEYNPSIKDKKKVVWGNSSYVGLTNNNTLQYSTHVKIDNEMEWHSPTINHSAVSGDIQFQQFVFNPLLKDYVAISTEGKAYLKKFESANWQPIIVENVTFNGVAFYNDSYYFSTENRDVYSSANLQEWSVKNIGENNIVSIVGNDSGLAVLTTSNVLFSVNGSSWESYGLAEEVQHNFKQGMFVAQETFVEGAIFTTKGTFHFIDENNAVCSYLIDENSNSLMLIKCTSFIESLSGFYYDAKGLYIRGTDGKQYRYTNSIGEYYNVRWWYNSEEHFLNDITYGAGKFVGATNSGIAMISSDAINWFRLLIPTNSNILSVSFDGHYFWLAGSSGELLYSSDGEFWQNEVTGLTGDISKVLTDDTHIVANTKSEIWQKNLVGDGGNVFETGESETVIDTVLYEGRIYFILGKQADRKICTLNEQFEKVCKQELTSQLSDLFIQNEVLYGYSARLGNLSISKDFNITPVNPSLAPHFSLPYIVDGAKTINNKYAYQFDDGVWLTSNFVRWEFWEGIKGIAHNGSEYLAIMDTGISSSTDGQNWINQAYEFQGEYSDITPPSILKLENIDCNSLHCVITGKGGILGVYQDGIWKIQQIGSISSAITYKQDQYFLYSGGLLDWQLGQELIPPLAIDSDQDSIPDVIDLDDDNDGYADFDELAAETDPLDPASLPSDTDGDFISNATDLDDDNDGILDTADAYQLVSIGDLLDTDNDGTPNACDENCVALGMLADTDDDNDGVLDVDDAFPLDHTRAFRVRNDVDGDGKSDLLWRSSARGWNFLWAMDGTQTKLARPINVVQDDGWLMAGQGDYDGDGKSDILWRNTITGLNFIYLMDGLNIKARQVLNYVDAPQWELAGSGDLNGDGKGDLLWHDIVRGRTHFYMMDGLRIGTNQPSVTVTDLNEKIVATGDVNGDGTDDVIWRNQRTGGNSIWIMKNGQITGMYVLNRVSADWTIAGAGDLDGDGTDDIVLRNQADGRNWAFMMEKGQIKTSQLINTVGSLDWQIADMGDYDGDGKVDFLWRNESAARNIIHLMDGLTIKDKGVLRPTDNTWQLAK